MFMKFMCQSVTKLLFNKMHHQIVERVNGAVKRAHRSYQLLSTMCCRHDRIQNPANSYHLLSTGVYHVLFITVYIYHTDFMNVYRHTYILIHLWWVVAAISFTWTRVPQHHNSYTRRPGCKIIDGIAELWCLGGIFSIRVTSLCEMIFCTIWRLHIVMQFGAENEIYTNTISEKVYKNRTTERNVMGERDFERYSFETGIHWICFIETTCGPFY